MNKKKQQISSGQLMVLIIAAQMGVGIFIIPQHLEKWLGTGGWLMLIPFWLAALGGAGLILGICRRFNGSVLAINRRLLGKCAGTALNYLIAVFLFISAIINGAFFVEFLKILFFKETPVLILMVFLFAPLFYLVAKGLKVICRFAGFIYISIFFFLTAVILSWDHLQWTFLFPLTQIQLRHLPQIVGKTAFSLIGFDLMLIIYPYIKGEHKLGYSLAAITTTALIYVILSVLTITLYGGEFVKEQVFPILNIFRSLHFPVLDRLEIYFLLFWVPAIGISATAFFLAAQLAVKENFPVLSYRLILVILGTLMILAILFLNKYEQLENLSCWLGTLEFFGFGMALPAFLWLIALIREARE